MNKHKFIILICLLLIIFSSISWPDPVPVLADKLPGCLPEICFGGKIIKKDLRWCLIKVSFPPFVVPNPIAPWFYLTHVFQPGDLIQTVPFLHKFYDVPFLSTEKLRYRPKKTVETFGAYIPGASEGFRQTCTANKDSLPKAPQDSFGMLDYWGTGCLVVKGEFIVIPTGKCLKAKK